MLLYLNFCYLIIILIIALYILINFTKKIIQSHIALNSYSIKEGLNENMKDENMKDKKETNDIIIQNMNIISYCFASPCKKKIGLYFRCQRYNDGEVLQVYISHENINADTLLLILKICNCFTLNEISGCSIQLKCDNNELYLGKDDYWISVLLYNPDSNI